MKIISLVLALSGVFAAITARGETPSLQPQLDAITATSVGKLPADKAKTMEDATSDLRKSGIVDKAIRVGETLPPFELPNAEGKIVHSKELLAKGPIVISFYRGGWCPYCNTQLHAYQTHLAEFKQRGATLVAITPATPDDVLTTTQKHELAFPVLTDAGNKYGRQLRIVFHIPDTLRKVYQDFGIDLKKNQGNDAWDLPLPGTFVVDRSGKVAWEFVDVDYKKRAEPAAILAALDKLKGK